MGASFADSAQNAQTSDYFIALFEAVSGRSKSASASFCVSRRNMGPLEAPKCKEQSNQYTPPVECALDQLEPILCAGMVIVNIFWDSQSVIYIENLEKDIRSQGCNNPNH